MAILELCRNKNLSDKVAIVSEGKSSTYFELDAFSLKIATKLKKCGVSQNDTVALYLPRGIEMFASIFAVLKLGAYYIPLENTTPKERVAYIKDSCSAKIVIEDEFFNDLDENIDFFEDNNSGGCIIYTSASTGNPKGVKISKTTILNHLKNINNDIPMDECVNFLYLISISSVAHIVYSLRAILNGGTLHVASHETRKDIVKIQDYILKNNITQTMMTPQMYKYFNLKKSSLEKVFVASERAVNLNSCGDFVLYNAYGSSETLWTTYFKIDKKYENTPIGKPINGQEIVLLDGNNNITSEEGEIAVAGDISDGYVNSEIENNVKYININGKRYFKTNDIAKYDENGDLIYLNRNDWMVKINGQRVEPSEIESVVRGYKKITEAVVKGFENNYNQTYLCCYFSADEKINVTDLKNYLSDSLDLYMIPLFFVQLDKFPLNTNGKINRKILDSPDISVFKTEFVAPETKIEKDLCEAFEKVLDVKNIGVNDDFFALGGDSIQVVSLAKELENYAIESRDVFLGKTPRNISKIITSKKGQSSCIFEPAGEISVLTQGQMGIYFACIENPENLAYNIPIACPLSKETDEDKLYGAILQVINNYSAFGVRFEQIDGEVRMIAQKPFIDVKIRQSDDIEKTKKSFVRPFNIENGNLSRFEIVRTEENLWLLLDFHHIISDGTSVSIVLDAISKAYFDELLPKEDVTLFAVANAEEKLIGSKEYQKAYAFFKSEFEANELENNLLEDETEENKLYSAKTVTTNLCEFINTTDVNYYIRKHGITESTFFMGACAWALCKAIGNTECLLSTVNNGRHSPQLEKTVGMLVHTMPLAIKLDEEYQPAEYLSNLQTLFFDTMANDCYPFYKLAKEFNVNNDVAFVYQSEMLNDIRFGKDSVPIEFLDTNWAISKITIHILKSENSYKILLQYRTDLYSQETISMLIMLMKQAMKGFLNDKKLKEISLIDSDTLNKLEVFNTTPKNDSNLLVLEMFQTQVSKHPDKIAIVSEETRLTYRELDEITDKLARYLVSRGVKKEDVVAILSERNEYMVICPLAVIKAGGMYQPLDNTYPTDRLNFMLKDSVAKLLITPKNMQELVDFTGEVINTEDIEKLEFSDIELPKIDKRDAFVILYTSGSTGLPKGCVLEHGNITAFLKPFIKRLKIDVTSSLGAYASFGFDANLNDTYSAICSGATLHIIPLDIRLDMFKLNDYFEENNITHVFMTTQVGRQFVTTVDNCSLKFLIVGGEALTSLTPPRNFTMVNGYGPTETTCGVTGFVIDKFYQNTPIGKAIGEVKLYVVDKNMNRVPFNVAGELLIAGPQVSRGYLNRAELTSKAFIENPYTEDIEYKRMYRTGDIVRMLPDGNLQFIGRKDSQVKIRGFRIELTEIEEVIRRFRGIKDATVVASEDDKGCKFIVAYLVSDEKINIKELNDFIETEKPTYMVPAVTMQIDEIPLNQNGKVNKKALPKPVKFDNVRQGKEPSSEIEIKFCKIYEKTLGIDKVFADDDFFELGGTSLSASKVAVDCMLEKIPISYSNIFELKTPEKLAKFINDTPRQNANKNIAINKNETSVLAHNNIQYLDEVSYKAIDNVLICGVTGFLGIHILKELLESNCQKIYCLIRRNELEPSVNRLKTLLMYYFDESFDKYFDNNRINVIEADITSDNLSDKLQNYKIDYVINSVAVVKHFVVGDEIERVNIGGVENLIKFTKKMRARLIQISTLSIAGESIDDNVSKEVVLTEKDFNIGQTVENNRYIYTKYIAEERMIEAIKDGLDGKIIRVGNLMSRLEDGEFQANFSTNAFMKRLKAYVALGKYSVNDADIDVEFSPIDSVAKAIVLLSGVNKKFTVFHVNNCYTVHLTNIFKTMRDCGINVKMVSEEEFQEEYCKKLADEKYSTTLQSLTAYSHLDGKNHRMIDTDNSFTVKALYRIGFSWSIIDSDYLRKAIEALKTLNFFDVK